MSDPKDPKVEFDTSDLDTTPTEGARVSQDELDHHALVEQGKRITTLELRVEALETRLDEELRLVRRLRKLMATWASDV